MLWILFSLTFQITQRGFRRQIETFQFNQKAALKKVATTALRKQTWTKDQNEKKVGDDSVFLFFPLLLLIPIIHSATFYTCIVWDKPRLTYTRPLAYLRRMEIVRRHTSLRIDANIHNDLVSLGKILDAKAIRHKLLENLEEPYCLF